MKTTSAAPIAARRAGFTLVELLVVVLILAILMAVALPLYLAAIQTSTRRTARSNLHMLMGAEAAYRLKNPTYTGVQKELTDAGDLPVWPQGPGNTAYTLYTQGALPAPDGRQVPATGVAACAKDAALGANGDYGCFIPGQDTE